MSKLNIAGRVGNGELVGNAHQVKIGRSYNGSGAEAFGGAEEWPTIYAEVAFQSHEGQRAIAFAKKLTALIHAEFDEHPPTNTGEGGSQINS